MVEVMAKVVVVMAKVVVCVGLCVWLCSLNQDKLA